MTEDFTIRYKRIPEHVVPGKPLGRHVRHDSRSLSFLVPRTDPSTWQTMVWTRAIPILDQGNVGSCTGNAATGALGTMPLYTALKDQVDAGLALDEEAAVRLYSAATALDPYQGTYPPEDTGSDGLSVAKAVQSAGLISGYTHATSLDAMISALQTGPVIVGVNWYEGFDNPAAGGLVAISGEVRGGHEFEVTGVDVERQRFLAANSWGPGWGMQGYFTFSWDTMTQLLAEDGDCTQLLPLNVPAPTPTPPPQPANNTYSFTDDQVAALDKFANHKHIRPYVVAAAVAWADARN